MYENPEEEAKRGGAVQEDDLYENPAEGAKKGGGAIQEDDLYENPEEEAPRGGAAAYQEDDLYENPEENAGRGGGGGGIMAIALYDYQAQADDEISFDPNDIISNIEMVSLCCMFLYVRDSWDGPPVPCPSHVHVLAGGRGLVDRRGPRPLRPVPGELRGGPGMTPAPPPPQPREGEGEEPQPAALVNLVNVGLAVPAAELLICPL